ncbi:MAG: glycosyltransferase [Archangium sp.]|nr:glycosyltransferase [Archangium sp.]
MTEPHVYDNQYAPGNVYGHAAALIRSQTEITGVHIDVGCSFGRIAETLETIPGLTYLGIDASEDGLTSLRERGIECHQHTFGDHDRDREFIARALAGRKLRSMSILDTLEHLVAPEKMLKLLFEVCREGGQPLIVSVPNVAHRDLGFKLAFGTWDYTPAGLLDQTHVRFFTEPLLTKMTRSVGWKQVASNDVLMSSSDQRFPAEHLALTDGSALRGLLTHLNANRPNALTNQFVRAFVPDAPTNESFLESQVQPRRPFLSVVTRTQGKRLDTLREVLLCLSAQTCDDFEVLIIGHRLDDERQMLVRQLIEESCEPLRSRVRLVLVNHGTRTTPLNVGFSEARGQYISILDDDDVPFAHWVEEFLKLSITAPGRMLRTVAVRQEFDEVQTRSGRKSVRAMSGMHRDYPDRFDLLKQLCMNFTPNTALAFPRSAFHDFGLRFDESLTTTEDWDFLMRVAFICDVASSDQITCIYRWWRTSASSRTEHAEEEWQRNLERILEKFDQEYLILPPGSATRLRHLMQHFTDPDYRPRAEKPLKPAHFELLDTLESPSWKLTQPIRIAGRALGHPAPLHARQVVEMSEDAARSTLNAVRKSKTMKFASFVVGLTKRLSRKPK